MRWMLSDKISVFRALTSIDEEDVLDGEDEDLEEEKSEPDSSDNDERDDNLDELEEFRHSNVDCASGDVVFINDLGENMEVGRLPVEVCAADANEDKAAGDCNGIEVR
jgi:hypothetical protein